MENEKPKQERSIANKVLGIASQTGYYWEVIYKFTKLPWAYRFLIYGIGLIPLPLMYLLVVNRKQLLDEQPFVYYLCITWISFAVLLFIIGVILTVIRFMKKRKG